jgi:hypothetical protein
VDFEEGDNVEDNTAAVATTIVAAMRLELLLADIESLYLVIALVDCGGKTGPDAMYRGIVHHTAQLRAPPVGMLVGMEMFRSAGGALASLAAMSISNDKYALQVAGANSATMRAPGVHIHFAARGHDGCSVALAGAR